MASHLPAARQPLIPPDGPPFRWVGKSLTIILPPPHSMLTGHNNQSWKSRASLVQALRMMAREITKRAIAENRLPELPLQQALIRYSFFFIDDRIRDEANAIHSQKAAIDGIVDAGLIADDNWQRLHIESVTCGIDHANPRTELTFRKA